MSVAIAYSQAFADEPDLLYGKVVGHDYLEHEAIAHEVVKVVDRIPHVRRILDLGCGDAEVIARLSRRREIEQYFAVDRNRAALDRAGARLQDIAGELRLLENDMLDFLWSTSEEFDLILLGYAMNSLELDEKRALMRLARRRLSPDGVLLVYDVFGLPGESREDCLEGYARVVEENWQDLNASEIQAVKTHISRCCAPEDVDTLRGLASRAGLHSDPEPLWTGQNPYHKLISARVHSLETLSTGH